MNTKELKETIELLILLHYGKVMFIYKNSKGKPTDKEMYDAAMELSDSICKLIVGEE